MATSNAAIYVGQTNNIPIANAFGNVFEEWQVATANQTVFTLVSFAYTPNTRTLQVYKAGILQQLGVAYSETSNSTVTFFAGATVGDKFTFRALATSGAALPSGGGVPVGGTAGQALIKVNASDYNSVWSSLTGLASLLDSPRQNVVSAITVALGSLATVTRNIQITGNTPIAGFSIANGQLFAVTFAADNTLTSSANLITHTGADIPVFAGDTCIIRAINDNIVEVLSYSSSQLKLPGNFMGFEVVSANRVLTIRDSGKIFVASIVNPTITLPSGNTIPIGTSFTFQNSFNVVAFTGDLIIPFAGGGTVSSATTYGYPVTLTYRGGTVWSFTAGIGSMSQGSGTSIPGSNPFKIILPGGFMVQGGSNVTTTAANGQISITYPTAFSTVPFCSVASNGDVNGAGYTVGLIAPGSGGVSSSASTLVVGYWNGTSQVNAQTMRTNWLSIGAQ